MSRLPSLSLLAAAALSLAACSAPTHSLRGTPDAPVVVQPYYQNTAVVPQAPPAMQISGRDDAFVF